MNTNSTLSGQIDLLALAGAQYQTIGGQDCIVIPKESNPSIFVTTTKNGATKAYLDVVIRESPGNQFGNTHFVKACVGKSNRERLGLSREDLQQYTPIIGNLKVFEGSSKPSQQSSGEDLPEEGFQGF